MSFRIHRLEWTFIEEMTWFSWLSEDSIRIYLVGWSELYLFIYLFNVFVSAITRLGLTMTCAQVSFS